MKFQIREDKGKEIKCEVFDVIVHNFNYYLSKLTVYPDGKIDCWGLMNFEEFQQKLNSGWICLEVPKNSELHIHDIGIVSIYKLTPKKSKEDFIKEIEDSILELNDKKGRTSRCIESFKNYLIDDNLENFQLLKADFNDLPSHKKLLFEYVDYKDPLIELMKTEKELTIDQRKVMLNDYFEDEWNESEFRINTHNKT